MCSVCRGPIDADRTRSGQFHWPALARDQFSRHIPILCGKESALLHFKGGRVSPPETSENGPCRVAPPQGFNHSNGRQLSDILTRLALDENRLRISAGDLLDVFAHRAFGALIFIFAVPHVLPIAIPGMSSVLGAPLVFLTWQLMVGRPKPWLPAVIRQRSFDRTHFAALVRRIGPWLQRLERLIRPRMLWMTEPAGERLIGTVGFVLAVILFLPIPMGNILPGLALALLAFGILERDGVAIALGMGVGAIGLALVAGVVYAMAKAVLFIVQNAIGL